MTRFGYEVRTPVIHDPLQTAFVQFLALPGDRVYLEFVSPDGPESPSCERRSQGRGTEPSLLYRGQPRERQRPPRREWDDADLTATASRCVCEPANLLADGGRSPANRACRAKRYNRCLRTRVVNALGKCGQGYNPPAPKSTPVAESELSILRCNSGANYRWPCCWKPSYPQAKFSLPKRISDQSGSRLLP